MTPSRWIVLLLVGAGLLAACARPATPPAVGATTLEALEGSDWTLVRYGLATAPATPLPDARATAEFDNLGELHGTLGCNNYFVPIKLAGTTLTVGEVEHTRQACGEALLAQEAALIEALGQAQTLTVTGDALALGYEGGTLHFERVPPPTETALSGTRWRLVAFTQGEGSRPPLDWTTVTLAFDQDQMGVAAGDTGCNGYGGPYRVEGERLTFEEIAQTAQACEAPGVMVQEAEYIQALSTVRRFARDGDTLVLHHERGTLRFEPLAE